MAHKVHFWISKMNYTLFDGFPDLMNVDCLPPSFNLKKVDGDVLHEQHLGFRCDSTNRSLQLIHNAFVSKMAQVVASILASDRQTSNCTYMSASCLPSHNPLLLQHSLFEWVSWQFHYWDQLPKSRLYAIVVTHNVWTMYRKNAFSRCYLMELGLQSLNCSLPNDN